MRRAFLFGVVLSALAASLAVATVRRVPAEYPSIQQAIMDCNDGDTVIVSPGVYYETINFGGKNITVTSTDPNDRGIVGYTIINADGDGTVVTFENRETNKAVLTGFTITGGVGTLSEWSDETWKEFYGAGIYCYNASPTISHCVITRNHGPYYQRNDGATYEYAYSTGGGICCMGGNAVITHNTIYNNSCYDGGGIYASGMTTISNNLIYNNSAAYGGGVYISQCYLINNTIVNNDVSKQPEWGMGGNVYVYFSYYSNGGVVNNVICGAKSGGGLCHSKAHDDLIRFNNVWNNAPANYGFEDPRTYDPIWDDAKADWTGRFGNISVDPLFRNAPMNDFHLQPESPCVSAGDPNSLPQQTAKDMDGDPRIFALRVDMGADEHIGYVKPLAGAGTDQHKLTPEAITLDAGASYFSDPNGARTYQWRQVQGAPVELSDATAEKPTFTPPAEGWYIFELVVNDGQHTSKPDRMLVVIGNEAPVANAGPDTLWQAPGYITLDGARSRDADPPDTLTYTWKQIGGPPVQLSRMDPDLAELLLLNPGLVELILADPLLARMLQDDGPTTGFACTEPGIYVFELVVSDGFTTSAPDTVKIEASRFTIKENPLDLPAPEQNYVQGPTISGAKLVYSAGNYNDGSWSIQCLDLESGRVDTLQAQMTDAMPETDGDVIVWTTGPEGYYRAICTSVVAADVSGGPVQVLGAGTNTESCGYPAISGRKVVWLRHRGVTTGNAEQYAQTPYDICGADIADLANPVLFTIAERVGHGYPYPIQSSRETYEKPVDISGNLVVWEADGDIYGADISDLNHIKVFPICTAPEVQNDPSISGHTVVWTDQRRDAGDIYGADISDPDNIREFEVYVGPARQTQPDIDGALVVYVEGSTRGYMRLCCLSREYGAVPFQLPGWYYGGGPVLDGSTLIWHDYSQVRGLTLDFGYGLTDGPIQNITTGTRYDYIQHAIDAAGPNDVIVVEPGIHREKVRLKGKGLVVKSTDPEDPAVRAATVITGGGQQVSFLDGETADCIVTGFTIAGGSYGVFCGGSTPTIADCDMVDNSYAGVKIWNSGNPTFTRCEIVGNATGAEMWAHREKRIILRNYGTFRNCLIAGNREAGFFSGYPTLENCTVADNLGIGVDAILAKIANSILYFNYQGAEGGNLRVESAQSVVTYSDVQGGWEGEGNSDADPLFIARGQEGVAGDYHLKSQGWSWNVLQGAWAWDDVTSPCIDAGDPGLPIGAEPPCAAGDPLSERAGANTRIDMGAYGGTAQASLAPHGPTP